MGIRSRLAVGLLALLAGLLFLAGCGGHSSTSTSAPALTTPTGPSPSLRSATQRTYKVKLPNGQTVTQIHDPALAASSRSLRPKAWALTITPTVEQYDSVTTSTIPQGAQYVAGYVDGLYQTYWGMRGHYPHVLGISVRSQDGADCLDEEPGNPGPSATGPWVKWQLSQGNTRPCIYSMLSWFSQINANLSAWGIARSQVREWDANWTYVPHLDWGYDCTQWTDRSRGLNLDESTCSTAFYPQPKPPPLPRCLASSWPHTTACRLIRYGYNFDRVDKVKLDRLVRLHGCTASRHPSYCRGWLYWDMVRAAELKALLKAYG